jgi:hypothetical protein
MNSQVLCQRLLLVLWAVLSVCAAACEGREAQNVVPATVVAEADTSVADSTHATELDSASSAHLEKQISADDPFAIFGLENETNASATDHTAILVWIVNQSRERAVIRADAGAGAVIVDSIRVGDSVEVKLETTADSVLISAVGPSGVLLGREWVGKGRNGERAVFP